MPPASLKTDINRYHRPRNLDANFKIYIETNLNWFEDFDVFGPSTNNALELFVLEFNKAMSIGQN